MELAGWLNGQFESLHGDEVESYNNLLDDYLAKHSRDYIGAPEVPPESHEQPSTTPGD